MLLDRESGVPFHDIPKVRWTHSTTGHSGVVAKPEIVDFNMDGRLEVVVPTTDHYVEAFDVNTGNKIPGFPVTVEDSGFVSKGIRYLMVDKEASIVSAINGFIYFIDGKNQYISYKTIKIPPVYVPSDWYKNYEVNDRCIIMNLNKVVITEAISDDLYSREDEIAKSWKTLMDRHFEHKKDIKYVPTEYENDPFFQNSLTEEGKKTLVELFHNAKKLDYFEDNHADCKHAAIYDNYAKLDGDFKYARLRSHILSNPELIETADGKRLIVPVTYYINPTKSTDATGKKVDKIIDETKYCVSAIAIIDPRNGKIHSLTTLDMTVMNSTESAALLGGLSVVEENGQQVIIVGNAAGRINKILVSTGEVIKTEHWPIQVGPITNKVIVEDVTGDGKLNIVVGDIYGIVRNYDLTGKKLWEINLGYSIIHDIKLLRTVVDKKTTLMFIPLTNGVIHCIDGESSLDVDTFPITMGNSELVGPLGLVRDGSDVLLTVSSASGKMAIHELTFVTGSVLTNLGFFNSLKYFKDNIEVKRIKAQSDAKYLVYLGGHSLDIDDVVYTEPLAVLRNVGGSENIETFRTSKIFKKNGWNRMDWEKRVKTVEMQKEKQKKYSLIEQLELTEEKVMSLIFGTKNGQVICIDRLRHHEGVENTQPLRGLYIKHIEAFNDRVNIIIEYEEIGDTLKELHIYDTIGLSKILKGKELEDARTTTDPDVEAPETVQTYFVTMDISKKPQVVTMSIIGINTQGIQTTVYTNYPIHNDFYKNIPVCYLFNMNI